MAKLKVVSQEKFIEIVNDLKNNSDFFDPFYLENGDWKPLAKEYYTGEYAPEGFDADEYWEVVSFLQDYSDVELVGASHVRKDNEKFAKYVNDWYKMYESETKRTPEESYNEGWQRPDLEG